MSQRRRVVHIDTFEDRLAAEAARCQEAAEKLPYGLARDMMLRRARQSETASHMNQWLSSAVPKVTEKQADERYSFEVRTSGRRFC
jgi:hypothetical protein